MATATEQAQTQSRWKRIAMLLGAGIALLVANAIAMAFVVGFGIGLINSESVTAYGFAFVGATVWILPWNLLLFKRLLEWSE